MHQFPNIILYAIPFFIIAMVVEVVYTVRLNLKSYQTKDSVTSLSMGIGNVLLGFISKAIVIAAFYFVYDNDNKSRSSLWGVRLFLMLLCWYWRSGGKQGW